MKKYIFTFVLAIVSGLWMVSEGVEAAKGSILEETIGKPEGLLGRWLNVSNEENVSILTFDRSDITPPYEGLVVAHNGIYGQEFFYYRDGDKINFISSAPVQTDDTGNKNNSFTSNYSIEGNTILTLDHFYYNGKFIQSGKFYRDESELANAQALFSGRWFVENATDTISYSFLPDQSTCLPNGTGLVMKVKGDTKLEGARYKIEQKEDNHWTVDFSAAGGLKYTYQICKLTMDEMVWMQEENGEQHYTYLKHIDIAYEEYEQPTNTILLYARDDSGSSTVDPVDPNQIYATLTDNVLTVHNNTGAQVTFTLNNTSVNNVAARVRKNGQPTSFTESISVELTEDGLYEIWLTSEEWNYSVFGTINYVRSATTITKEDPASTTKKILRGTQILIKREGKTYTLTGQEVK